MVLGGVRTKAKYLTLQEAVDLVMREKEKVSFTLTSDSTTFETDITANEDAVRLHIYLFCDKGDVDLHLYDKDSNHIGFNYETGCYEVQFMGTYSGTQSNPEIISVENPAGNTYHIKVKLTHQSEGGNGVTLLIMEEPIRPEVMATYPVTIETDGFPGAKGLGLNVKIGEASTQQPLNNLKVSITQITNKYGQALTFTSDTSFETDVLPAGGEMALQFTVDIPSDATEVYRGKMTIYTETAGEIEKSVIVRVDTDEDKLPDYWEKMYEFNPELADSDGNGISDADEDYDGDGYTNIEEYYGSSDPTDPDSKPSFNKGDINKDGRIDISDVILCLRMAIGLDPVNVNLADMNNDGVVDIADVILILRKAVGLD